MKKETYAYPSTMARMKAEYKIFILAFVFIVIADSIGQIQVPLGPGTLILFPIFYSLIMGVISGPEVLKIFNKKEVKAASKLVIVAYCSIIGLLAASPLCPAREFVIASANSINFTAPLTLVGAYAGISIGDQIKSFVKQGWKMIIVGVLVMTGTFLGSACIAQLVLSLTNAI